MKLTISGVQSEAAPMRSASFSREGSSATMTRRPAAISAMISSMGLKESGESDMRGCVALAGRGFSPW